MRTRAHVLGAGAILAVLMVGLVPSPAAAQRAHVGFRAGYNFDFDDPAVGGHFAIPLAPRLDLYPSLDVYLPEDGTRLVFNGDFKYRFATRSAWEPYAGAGLSVMHRSINDVGDNDVGANVLGGVETRLGAVHPFFEGRIVLQNNTSFQLLGGINITLYGR